MTMHLGMSGGYALNCPNNSRLMSGFGFRTLIAPPCPNDSGQAIGVGLAVLHSRIPELEFKLSSAYLGRPAIHAPRLMPGAAHTPPSSSEFDTAQFVADVESGPVGWVSGCSEIGPRALGHRSILADPRNQASKTQLNAVKGRQWWRPVAPLVLQGHVGDWFTGARASKYMLETFDIIPSKRPLVPAVVHLDGSARVQTLLQVDDPLLYRALDAFAASTAVPILCNTSLNDRGEPITQTAQQAIEFCAAKGIHICYVDGERVEVHQSLDYRSMERELHVRVLCAAELAVLTERLNPHGLSSEEIYFFITTPQLCQLNPSRQADANVIRTAAKDYYDTHPSDLEWVSRRAASAHQSASVLVAES